MDAGTKPRHDELQRSTAFNGKYCCQAEPDSSGTRPATTVGWMSDVVFGERCEAVEPLAGIRRHVGAGSVGEPLTFSSLTPPFNTNEQPSRTVTGFDILGRWQRTLSADSSVSRARSAP